MPAFGFVVNSKNEILLIQRGYGKDRGKWSLPGGMRDRGESLKSAAVRETLEETGIKMSADTLYYKNKSGSLETWRGRERGGSLKIQRKECWDAKWFQPDMLPHDDMLAFGPDKIVIGKWACENRGSRRVHYPRVQMRRAGFALVVNERLEVLLVREEGRQRRGSWRLPGELHEKPRSARMLPEEKLEMLRVSQSQSKVSITKTGIAQESIWQSLSATRELGQAPSGSPLPACHPMRVWHSQ